LPGGWSLVPYGAGGSALAVGLLAATRPPRRSPFRKQDGTPAEEEPVGTGPNPAVVFVFVSGHGSHSTGTFETLQALMGIGSGNVAHFNWEWTALASYVEATKQAEVDEAAHALEAFLGGLARSSDSIYLVGHSKGAVTITQMLAWWDAYPTRAQPSVIGAALLDPPISRGSLGFLQSIGHYFGIASDGKFEPVQCLAGECRDRREHLGETAGVGVFVVRNPDAGVTSFRDEPAGLRVYDLDDGGGPATDRILGAGNVFDRIGEAHSSPLKAGLVADCIAAESWRLGSCVWPVPPPVRTRQQARRRRYPIFGRGGPTNQSVR
jgi:hypothetical protein